MIKGKKNIKTGTKQKNNNALNGDDNSSGSSTGSGSGILVLSTPDTNNT